VRSASLGIAIAEGWYATGVSYAATGGAALDCSGFTSLSNNGIAWRNTTSGSWPEVTGCATDKPLLCCDTPP
jgi:hypothetical protein